MTAIQRITCASLVFASLGGTPLWAAEASRDFALGVNEANATLRGGDVDGALEQYSSMREIASESADLAYNMAVAQYRKGDVAAAEQLFQSAATSENDSLAANARYNLGNCNYASGLELSQTDRPAAIEQLESAIENYRSALAVDPSNADARANIELASRLIDQLREEEKQQDEQNQNQQNQQQDQQQQSSDQQQNNRQQNSQDQQQQDQQQSDQKQQQQDQQQDSQSSQGNEQQQQDQQQSGGDQQQQESENQQQREKQQQSEQQSEQDQSKADESQSDQSKSKEQSQPETQSESQQSQDAQPQNQQQPSQPSQRRPQDQQPQDGSSTEEADEKEDQQPPEGELTAAAEEESKEGQDRRQVATFDPSKDGEMTQQEAEKMLQAIRDRDMARRFQRRQDELRRHVPVDRDW